MTPALFVNPDFAATRDTSGFVDARRRAKYHVFFTGTRRIVCTKAKVAEDSLLPFSKVPVKLRCQSACAQYWPQEPAPTSTTSEIMSSASMEQIHAAALELAERRHQHAQRTIEGLLPDLEKYRVEAAQLRDELEHVQREAERWRRIAAERQRVLVDITRCEHGRVRGDQCSACPDQVAPDITGRLLGYGIDGTFMVLVPSLDRVTDPAAWYASRRELVEE